MVSRAERRASLSLETTPKPNLESPAIPSSPIPAFSPVTSPPTINPPTPVPGSLASDPNTIASLKARFNKKINLVVRTVAELGASLHVLMSKVYAEKVTSVSVVQVEEVATCPAGSPK